jgi:predicted transcriptional regulator
LEKYDKLFPALALIFHLVDCVTNGTYGQVTAQAARCAWLWCDYLEAHMRRCYGLLDNAGLNSAIALSVKIKNGALDDGFTARDVGRNRWTSLITDNEIHLALTMLENNGWLHSKEEGGGKGKGRRTTKFYIHPDIIANYGKEVSK